MIGAFAMLSPTRCSAVKSMWEWAVKEGLPLPGSANEVMCSLDGDMPLYYWPTSDGGEVRFTIDHYNMKVELELFDSELILERSYVFDLKLDLVEIKEG